MEYAGSGVEADVVVAGDLGVVPAFVSAPVDGDHVVGEVFAKTGVVEDLLKLLGCGGVRDAINLKIQWGHEYKSTPVCAFVAAGLW